MTSSSASEAAPSRLPLRQTIHLAYATFFNRFGDILRISWVWLVAAGLLSAASGWLKATSVTAAIALADDDTPQSVGVLATDFFATITALLGVLSIAVAWHRLLILHETPGASGTNIASGNLWRYCGNALLIVLLLGIPSLFVIVPFFLISPALLFVVTVAVYLLALLVGMRLSLVLPARAVDDTGLTLKAAWNATQGNSWRLFWGGLACTVPAAALAQLALLLFIRKASLSIAWGDGVDPVWFALVNGVSAVYGLLILPIAVGFLSHAYRHFSGRT
ncbi:hypothetical protein JQ557_14425 [Bradyrhizobium sp. U87765 SZCCT0131]|uniref:hypothetical protein n=1 Tax=unclassified Bradyrhizobium TaxID=2631580 RepID=UPI001BAB2A45|nr:MULTISPECIES: hypothetical protein [unclassified Bradyrhizobium]MBR1219196.1 hypothetical protein [Bradyrhizobium sp. U87765 SZCCT0131]MBR1261847.1 hypothetical protein [Bradyrhizobium sp. U87765 SZCCT0134]MBR1306300.1 hypothetical protein [Bradyrhizobium sp. U87765 SZCCT0110]MBR1317629.1 hypothetical protein [Bradyrhizobium sp. U87765 SZCCT0109]MBR1351331.1 hypothetical protein [Bradyrhizobium sp. U87765 SZCCT0048]